LPQGGITISDLSVEAATRCLGTASPLHLAYRRKEIEMKKTATKLTLNRETLRHLEEGTLPGVLGGVAPCTTDACTSAVAAICTA
jgi:hypothetical protein